MSKDLTMFEETLLYSLKMEQSMSKYKFDGKVYVANIGSGSTSVVGAIGNDADGTVIGRRTKRSKSSDEIVVGAIGDDTNGTVITDNADGDVIGAIGERANGTVIIED